MTASPAAPPEPAALLALAVDDRPGGRRPGRPRPRLGRRPGRRQVQPGRRRHRRRHRQRGADRRPAAGAPARTTACWGRRAPSRAGTSGVRWVVDPIDGTVNFLYDLPAYAVSIAAEVDGEVRAGRRSSTWPPASCSPRRRAAGRALSTPARPEPVRLSGSRPASLEQTLVATGFGYQRGAAPGPGRGGRRAAAAGARHPPASAARRSTCAPWPPAGSTPTTSCDLNPWDHAAGALVAAEAGLVVTGLPGRPFAEPMAIAAAPVDRRAVRRPARPSCTGLTQPAGRAQQAAAALDAGPRARGDLLGGGQASDSNSGPDDDVDLRGRAGVGVVAGAGQEQPRRRRRRRCRAGRAGSRRRRSPRGRWRRWRSRRRRSRGPAASAATVLGQAGRVGGVEDAHDHRGRVQRRAAPPAPWRRPRPAAASRSLSWRSTFHHTAAAARASTSRKISGGIGRRPLRARTGGRSVRSVTVSPRRDPATCGPGGRVGSGRSLGLRAGPRSHRRPVRRVPAPRTGRCAPRSRTCPCRPSRRRRTGRRSRRRSRRT